MDVQKVDMYLVANQKYFDPNQMGFIRDRLLAMDESRFSMLTSVELKDPTTLLLISIFLGYLGIDRFMLNDTGIGVLKLLTGGVCGILTIIDWFSISKKTKEYNFKNLMMVIG